MDTQQKIKLLLVTDDVSAMSASDSLLKTAPDIQVVASAGPKDNIETLVTIHQPDVVVMDYDVPGLNAAEVARGILREDPKVQIIMLSVVSDANDIRHAMRAGARDYLIKPLHEGELVNTILWLISERREYARTRAFIKDMRRAFETMFYDDKPVPDKVIELLEAEASRNPLDRLPQETLAVAYARNRDWLKLAPLANQLAQTHLG